MYTKKFKEVLKVYDSVPDPAGRLFLALDKAFGFNNYNHRELTRWCTTLRFKDAAEQRELKRLCIIKSLNYWKDKDEKYSG